ncbi:filamentous hemagglutinin N-terminal domain-containing protein [Aurantiacibacter gilvus]|uniref:Filamentous hemagglutinin N-terminal domain-containing protein n=1 Tax=Aurantiacibacter gilvus TaxID=3139141 RepID=A0ABU9IFX5_9SPHN
MAVSVAVTGPMKRRHLLLGLSLAALVASQAHAQVVTDIAPDGAAGFDTGTTVVTNGTQTQISGGEASGTNLFHSFARFDLGNGDTATWVRNAADANSITNIINRVRSGTPSNIDGTITIADMPNADFWFINPAGVVFGDGASVQVPNAAYFSTAQELGFGGGQRFSTVTPDGSTFSSAPPQAFGFLGGQGGIGILGAMTTEAGAQQPSSVHFVASDIRVDAPLFGNATEFSFAAVGADPLGVLVSEIDQPVGDGLIEFTPNAEAHVAGARFAADEVLFDGARLFANGLGNLALDASELAITNGALIETRSAPGQTGGIQVRAVNLTINGDAALSSISDAGNAAPGGAIEIAVGNALIEGGSILSSALGDGDAGSVTLDVAETLTIANGRVEALTHGTGNAGDVLVQATDLVLLDGQINSDTLAGGNGGSVTVSVRDSIFVDGGQSRISATTTSAGNAGTISLSAGSLEILGGKITSSTDGSGAGGAVNVVADDIILATSPANQGDINSFAAIESSAGANASGNAGSVNVTANNSLLIETVSLITAETRGSGDAGSVNVSTPLITMTGGLISSTSFSTGDAGDVTLVADTALFQTDGDISTNAQGQGADAGDGGDLTVIVSGLFEMFNGSELIAETIGGGTAGTITVDAGTLRIGNSQIAASTRSQAAGGNVIIRAGDLEMLAGGRITSSSAFLGQGDAGGVLISVEDTLSMVDDARILSTTVGDGNAGSIDIVTDTLLMDFSVISSAAVRGLAGNAGSVRIAANTVDMTDSALRSFAGGTGNPGTVEVDAGQITTQGSVLQTSNFGTGIGGGILLFADAISMDGTIVDSSTFAEGNAGTIRIVGGSLDMTDGSLATTTSGSGNAGSVDIDVTGRVSLGGTALITSSTNGVQNTGNAGSVIITADSLEIADEVQIDSSTREESLGNAGSADISVRSLTMSGGFIYTSTYGAGAAGNLSIDADEIRLSGDGSINSRAVDGATGDAGNVRVFASDLIYLADDSSISASTDGPGSAGSVSVETPLLTMTGGSIDSSTSSGGDAGNVQVSVTDAFLSGSAIVASNALTGSTGAAGKVLFDAAQLLEIQDQAGIIAGTRGTGNAGLVSVVTANLFMDGGAIASSTQGAGDAGDVLISGDRITIVGDARVNSGALPGSTGDAGFVQISTPNLLFIGDDAVVSASTAGPGAAGAVLVTAGELQMFGGEIASLTRGAGDAGLVLIDAGAALLEGEATINSLADGPDTGDAGDVFIKIAGQFVVTDGATVAASTLGVGNAGEVNVTADSLVLDGGQITSSTSGSGDAGDVSIVANDLLLLFRSSIDSRSEAGASGDAGDVTVDITDILRLEPESSISASSLGSGFAGLVEVRARVLDMAGGAINSFTAGSGDAGLVGVFVDELNMSGGRIDSASDSPLAGAGDAGSVFIAARTASLSGNAQIDSRASTGDAGDVTLDVFGLLEISDSGQVSAATTGSGQAGLVQVFADELIMTGGAINSFSNSSGDAGLVDVTARVIDMSGGRIDSSSDSDAPDAGDAGGVLVRGNDVRLSGNALIDSRGITGDAGDVQVEILGDLSMADEAQISAATDGSGEAGSVFVMADLLTMTGGEINSITTGSGRAGLVAVEVNELVMTGGRITSAAQNPLPVGNLSASVDAIANLPPPAGDAGNVFLLAGSAQLFGPASIDSTSEGSRAGTVDVLIDQDLLLFDGAQISTTAFGAGDAGDITIAATNLALDNFSQISSTAARDFSAGTIEISAQEIRILNGSEISTNSENGPAGDIGLFLPLDGFLYLAGREPGVITTSSGANTGGQIIISDPFLILSEGGSILALGQQGGANVQIQSAFFIRSSDRINLVSVDGSLLIESNVGEQITGTEVADIPFLDASGILSGQCTGVRQGGEVSQFSSRVTGPYAPPDASDEVEDEMDGSSPDQIVHVEQGALAPCG